MAHRLRRLRVLSNAHVEGGNADRAYDEAGAKIAKIVESADMKKFLLTQGAEPMLMDPPKFSEFLRAETVKWAKVVKAANLKLD